MASTEILFAQRLASNERKIRDKAIKKLKKYLEIRSKSKKGFSEDDFVKIWKGLHYCLWMQDKPLIHEELVQKITALVHSLSNHEQTFLFIKVFFITEAREWPTIDKWRMDKFLMLIRQFLRQSVQYLQNGSWHDSLIQKMAIVLQQTVLDPKNTRIALGFRSYFNGIYLDELKNTGLKKVTPDQFCQFLQPFFKFIAESRQKEVIIDITKKLFDPIINNPIRFFRLLQFDGASINEWLAETYFSLGKNPACSAWHRRLFYDQVKKIRDKQDEIGRSPTSPIPDYDTVDIQDDHEEKERKTEEELSTPQSKKKKKRKNSGDIGIMTPLNVVTSNDDVNDTDENFGNTNSLKSNIENKTIKRKLSGTGTLNTTASPSKKTKLKSVINSEVEFVKSSPRDKLKRTHPARVSVKSSKLKSKSVPLSKKEKKTSLITSSEKKKVVFDMKKNTKLKFKQCMKVSPLPAYSPTKLPEQGILKSPSSRMPQLTKLHDKAGRQNGTPKVKLFSSKIAARSSLTTSKPSPKAAKMTRS